ncbi:lysozyme [Loktanella sp. Alg231-35]|uniref:lysozyme n=1 Tax=Loktanella sp. Alg231-35 TaxID=1922220 RepID=UPI00131EFD57|nr:lysozyme [Loktanella sp. Alg231-35]
MSTLLTCGTAVSAQEPAFERVASGLQAETLRGGLGAAPGNSSRVIVKSAIELIKQFEGWFASPYNDPVGYCTIGYGHLVALKLCSDSDLSGFDIPLTADAGQAILVDDTGLARHAVERFVSVDLTDAQFGALSSFVFNVGQGNFSSSTLLKRVNASDFDGAAAQFHRWTMSRGVRLKGLVIRRSCEAALFSGRDLLNAQGVFDQNRCTLLGAPGPVDDPIDIIAGE